MRPIPKKLRDEIASDPYYSQCARQNSDYAGRITLEHALIFGGRQVGEGWSIIPLCEYHHAVNRYQDCGGLDKEINEWIALNRATDEQLWTISKAINYKAKRAYLNKKYGQRV